MSFQFARSNSQKSAGPHDLSLFPHGLGILGVLVPHKGLPALLFRFHVSAIPISRTLALALPLQTFGQLVEDISAFVYPTAFAGGYRDTRRQDRPRSPGPLSMASSSVRLTCSLMRIHRPVTFCNILNYTLVHRHVSM